MTKSQQLVNVFTRVRNGEDPSKVRAEVIDLLTTLQMSDVVEAEKSILASGTSIEQLRKLVYAFAAVLGDQVPSLRASLPASHIVRKILAEHEMISCFVAELKDVNDRIQKMSAQQLTQYSIEFRKLTHICQHLLTADVHRQREEDVIFPALKGTPCYGLCLTMRKAHIRIDAAINAIITLVEDFDITEPRTFKARLNALSTFLVPAMREHIFQEDNIVYPIALEVLSDDDTWTQIRDLCDQMGYCGFDEQPCYE